MESGVFQGAGWYRPDFGPIQLVAQISGRLFTFTKSSQSIYAVVEITIPGDPNDATTSQVWMWQSEKWLIITDGTQKFPIFYDGTTTRRSYGPSVILGVANAFTPGTPPAIGATVDVTLVDPYTGPFNVPVLMNGAFYQTVSGGGGGGSATYQVKLTAIDVTPGTLPIGSKIVQQSGLLGYITKIQFAGSAVGCISPSPIREWFIGTHTQSGLPNASACVLSAGSQVSINGQLWQIEEYFFTSFAPVGIRITPIPLNSLEGSPPTVGAQIISASGTGPSILLATTTATFINPGVGSNVIVTVDQPYTGTDGQVVWIGQQQYTIAKIAPLHPSTSLTLINLSDVSAVAYGVTEDILSVPELPAGRMGAYVLGQNWMSLTDGVQFIAGDIVGSAAGTLAYNKRDAVLKTTGQTFFGGNFSIPNSGSLINSMTATANLDTSLGQGALQVGTDSAMFSCLAPFDFQNPPDTRIPILTESLIGFGPLAQNSTIAANSDTLFRSFPGLASLVIARRDFGEWGNSPISREMTQVYSTDNQTLLPFGSASVFDNRFLDTCSPATNAQGTIHQGIVALNFDLISSLRGKAPPVYDGLWTGLNTLQLVDIKSGSESRCFAFCLVNSIIELHELSVTDGVSYQDDDTTRIEWSIETPILFNRDVKPLEELVRLTNGEMWLQEIRGTVNVTVQYRPDFYDGWVTWKTLEVCSPDSLSYRTRIGLGEPDGESCEANNNRPFRVGHFFQLKISVIGQAKLMGVRIQSTTSPIADFPPPVCDPCPQTLPIP